MHANCLVSPFFCLAIISRYIPRFTQADLHEVAPQLLDALLSKIEKAPTPEKVAENDYLMKCMC